MSVPLAEFAIDEITLNQGAGSSAWGRWLNVVSHLDPRYGGLSAVVPELAFAVGKYSEARADLAAFCAPDETYCAAKYPGLAMDRWPTSRIEWVRDRGLKKLFLDRLAQVDGVHIHGLWEQSTMVAADCARALHKPYVLSAHGMLEKWALRNKRWKKSFYAAFAERKNVKGAACLLALTHAEAEDYRRFGAGCPIAVIPNGVDIPEQIDSQLFLDRFPALQGKRIVLFLGRIHFKKGLDLLVDAWGSVAQRWPDAHLVLAGPDFEGTRARVEAQIVERGIGQSVTLTGMLRDEMKWSALAASECFVLPSYSEGLSVSTLEAMGVGLPVIVTEHCNLPEVSDYATGWVIRANVHDLEGALVEFFENQAAANRQMGQRGRLLVERNYNWLSVARRMSEVYLWVQGGPVPQSVDLLQT